MMVTGLTAEAERMEVKYIKRPSSSGREVYLVNPIWSSLYRPEGQGYEWMKEEDDSDTKVDVIKMIKKNGGVIFEEILDKGKTSLKKLSEDQVHILVEVNRVLSKIMGIHWFDLLSLTSL